ncbi:MAG: ABC transporter permease subunit, partial [Clostridia bacterium]|nr:ABC transporter permease subunit [Clostridia bacterium]
YIVKGFFDTVPTAIDEAARIDGASKNRIFWQMIIPLSKPIIVYTILTTFISPWCDYIMASVFIHDTSKYTIAVGIRAWVTDRELVNRMFTRFCAGSVLISVPIVILFMIMQKFYVAGITGGAAKG